MSQSTADEKIGVAMKAGFWYVICNFINRGIAFLTTPIFTRVLSKAAIGEFANYQTWMLVLRLVITMDMHVTTSRARYDFPGKIDAYSSSISVLSAFVTALFSLIFIIFKEQCIKIMGISEQMLYLMLITILFAGAFQTFQIRQRLEYKYKIFTFLTILVNVSSIILSLFLIFSFEDKLAGRVVGYTIPNIVVPLILFVVLIYKGKCFSLAYSKYCLKICLPFIPHLLSMNILGIVDRVMIKSICGAEDTALYTIGYTCAAIIIIFGTSLNQAWAPWLSEQLHVKDYENTRKRSKQYLMLFMVVVTFLCICGPEAILVMGGHAYAEAVYVLPPVIAGCAFQFMYTLYVNIETFEKKTAGMALATVIAASANLILNFIFIPIFGYIAAAFTTLIGYGLLFVMHFYMVKRLDLLCVYDTKFMIKVLGYTIVMIGVSYLLYLNDYVRLIVLSLVAVASIVIAIKKRKMFIGAIKTLLPNRKQKKGRE